jgi:hypothetical protein
MAEPTGKLVDLLASLTAAAHRLGLNDAQWAAKAGLPKETLSRLRRRTDCDLATLGALAEAAAARLTVAPTEGPRTTPDGHLPLGVDRDYEARLLELCTSELRHPDDWRALGPAFFMAGLAVMLASSEGHDRAGLLALAESLHPGSSCPEVFQLWLTRSPVRPSRFLPMLRQTLRHAA